MSAWKVLANSPLQKVLESPVTTILILYWHRIKTLYFLKVKMPSRKITVPWDICVEATIMEVVITMINDETKRKLRELNISEFINALETQQTEPATVSMTFDERMQRLVDCVYQEKYNSRIQRMIKSTRLRFPQADIHGIYYDGRGLNKELLTNYSVASI